MVTAPNVPGPGDTNPYPTVAPGKKNLAAWKIAALAVLGVVLMCFSGLLTLGSFIGPQPKPAAKVGEQTRQPVLAAPATTVGPPVASVSPTPSPTLVVTTAPAPTVAPRVVPKPTPTKPRPHVTTTKPKPKPKPTTRPPAGAVHPGAFCAPVGALGHTTTGLLMRCTLKAGEERARWRRA